MVRRATVRRRAPAFLVLAMLMAATRGAAAATAGALPVAVAPFDYVDTSGEVQDQTAKHQDDLRVFSGLLGDELTSDGRYRVVRMACSADCVDPNDGVAHARQAGARLLVFGGVHKMSTLLEWIRLDVVDVDTGAILLDRVLSFRGDTREAWQRAAMFAARTIKTDVRVP